MSALSLVIIIWPRDTLETVAAEKRRGEKNESDFLLSSLSKS